MPPTPPIDLEFDKNHIWHPYTSAQSPLPCYPVTHCDGVNIHLENDRILIDGMSSWWSAIHGYNHPVINAAIQQQLDKMSHVMFGGLTHSPAISLSKKLLQLTDPIFSRVFLADSGSVSVDVALKMALQYQQGMGHTKKHKIVSLHGGYHGDTFGAMSVCDPVNGMHQLFRNHLATALFLPRPECRPGDALSRNDKAAMAELFSKHKEAIAAVIVEPLVQGAGGMYFYDAEYLVALRQYCDEIGALLIFDEIATGFARTGELFAFQKASVKPDILCVGKALTGGYMTLAATLCSEPVAQGISQSEAGVFMHGPTFMGNPLACSAANASIELLINSPFRQVIQSITDQLLTELEPCRQIKAVADVRVLGAIGVVEMHQPVDVAELQAQFVDLGVWVRPFGRLVYIMPPYIINPRDLSRLTDAIFQVLGKPQE